MEYVVDNGYGIFERAPERIAARLSAWFSTERAELDAIAKRCAQVASPHPGGGRYLVAEYSGSRFAVQEVPWPVAWARGSHKARRAGRHSKILAALDLADTRSAL